MIFVRWWRLSAVSCAMPTLASNPEPTNPCPRTKPDAGDHVCRTRPRRFFFGIRDRLLLPLVGRVAGLAQYLSTHRAAAGSPRRRSAFHRTDVPSYGGSRDHDCVYGSIFSTVGAARNRRASDRNASCARHVRRLALYFWNCECRGGCSQSLSHGFELDEQSTVDRLFRTGTDPANLASRSSHDNGRHCSSENSFVRHC